MLCGVQRLPLLQDEKGRRVFIVSCSPPSLWLVTDEANFLSRLRPYFPTKSKFCFAFAPPHHHRPRLGSQAGSAHKRPSGSQLLCPSGNTLVWAVTGLLLLLINDNVWAVGYPTLPPGKATTAIFLSFFLPVHGCLQWDHICQAYGRDWLA